MKKINQKCILIIHVLIIILFSVSCQQNDQKFKYYIRYEILELNRNGNLLFVTIFDEIQSQDYKNFIRLGFSTISKLFLESKSHQSEFMWSANNNFKQKVRTLSIYEDFHIPLTFKDAIQSGFKQILDDNKGRVMVFESDNLSLKIKYYRNGQIMIKRAEKILKGGYKRIFHQIESQSSTYGFGSRKKIQLLRIKDEAEAGEELIYEANRKFPKYYQKFEENIKEMIEDILNNHPNYYYGLIDYGLSAASFDNNIKKALYYINKAKNLDENRPTAYALLFCLHYINKSSKTMKMIEKLVDTRLTESTKFQFDRIRILTILSMGERNIAEKIFKKRKKLYKNDKYSIELKIIKNSFKGKSTIIKGIW